MLTAPRKINTIINANFKCLRKAVREEYRGQCDRTNKRTNEQTNKYINSSLYSIRYIFMKVSKIENRLKTGFQQPKTGLPKMPV